MLSPVSTVQDDSSSGAATPQKSTSGAAHVLISSDIPAGAVFVNASSGNVAAATATASLPGVSAKTTYVTGFEITSSGATAAAVVLATLAGLISGTASYVYTAVAGVTLGNLSLMVDFSTPIPASALNTAITISLPSLGAGNTNACVNIHGYQL